MTNRMRGTRMFAACIALAAVFSMTAQGKETAPAKSAWTAADLLPLTCAQAWVKSGRSYREMISIVEMLARVSLANRDLTFPDTREAGTDAGRGIAEDCKADPNGLLFAIVDRHVRRVAEAATD